MTTILTKLSTNTKNTNCDFHRYCWIFLIRFTCQLSPSPRCPLPSPGQPCLLPGQPWHGIFNVCTTISVHLKILIIHIYFPLPGQLWHWSLNLRCFCNLWHLSTCPASILVSNCEAEQAMILLCDGSFVMMAVILCDTIILLWWQLSLSNSCFSGVDKASKEGVHSSNFNLSSL